MKKASKTALELTLSAAFEVGVSGVPRSARADPPVVPGGAVGVCGAVARVHALLLPAGQPVRAVVVEDALVGPAGGEGIGVGAVVLQAAAEGAVGGGLAEGVRPARLEAARVLAVALDASLVVGALVVAAAAGCVSKTERNKISN